MAHVMRLAAMLHSLVSLAMLIAYYHLKVPLAIFKREKEIARRLEFDGLYIVEQPEDDDIKSHWDKLVISAKYVLIFKRHNFGGLGVLCTLSIKIIYYNPTQFVSVSVLEMLVFEWKTHNM